ncbi:hypothetical protein GMES_2407 [Paraglaciecola mesophila KMM 241]|uniref:Uncharacterized protein n=1 Tax=Paraglaciecola mesophila KMM 241 TaxID=1128912 RepID=K6Z2T8_9ALTE|nr:hypothetical protein GMES_2407 [Paraglaciecola mesophila KMM 241]
MRARLGKNVSPPNLCVDLYGMTKGKPDILTRRTGVQEMAVYGDLFNLVLFQRCDYSLSPSLINKYFC